MSNKLVTIATFDKPTPAHLAKNALAEAGIQAIVTDESLVSMDWLLSNAVGGIKVQVWEDVADKAITVLEDQFGEHGEGLGVKVTPEELAAQAEAAAPDESEEPHEVAATPQATATSPPPDDEDVSVALSEREQHAQRAFLATVFGLFVPLFLFYAIYLMLVALFGDGPLGPKYKRRVNVTLVMLAFGLLAWFGWASLWPGHFFALF